MERRKTDEVYEIASKYRGDVLNEVAWMEKFLDVYITNYFTQDEAKKVDMHYLFLGDNRVALDNKRQIFHFIAEKYDLEWYQSYKSIRSNESKKSSIPMNKDLVYIIEQRNILAHRLVDTTIEALNDHEKISFITFKNSIEKAEYYQETYGELMMVIGDITKHFQRKIKK